MRIEHVRRFALLVLVGLVVAPIAVHAGAWQRFHNRALGFAVNYPSTWRATQSAQADSSFVTLQSSTSGRYALMVTVLKIRPGKSLGSTVQRFVAYERRAGNASYGSIRWSMASIAHHRAMTGVLKLSTEGGVPLAYGIYVVAWRSQIYDITLTSSRSPAPSTTGQFPGIYRQILRSWRFL